MTRYPSNAPRAHVIRTFQALKFELLEDGEFITLRRKEGGRVTNVTLPNIPAFSAAAMRAIANQLSVTREMFLLAFEQGR